MSSICLLKSCKPCYYDIGEEFDMIFIGDTCIIEPEVFHSMDDAEKAMKKAMKKADTVIFYKTIYQEEFLNRDPSFKKEYDSWGREKLIDSTDICQIEAINSPLIVRPYPYEFCDIDSIISMLHRTIFPSEFPFFISHCFFDFIHFEIIITELINNIIIINII